MHYIPHEIQAVLEKTIRQFPATLVTGSRQVGKSTLLKHIAKF